MAVLVTGVGYIGAALIERLLERGEEVVAIDNFFSTDARAIASFRERHGFRFVRGSVTSVKTLRAAFAAAPLSTVYALAAQPSASPAAAPVRYTENTNLLAPRLLLDCVRELGAPRLVFASSFKVYGPALPPVVTEVLPYGVFGDFSHLSKCYVEKLLEMYAASHGLTALSLRLGIVYGIGPIMKRDYRFMTAPNKFCLQVVLGEDIQLYPGCHLPAGFIHVADAAEAMIQAAESDLSGYAPINAATEMLSIAQVADLVAAGAERLGLRVAVRYPTAADDAPPPHNIAVRSRLQPFSARPHRNIADTVGELIDYFQVAQSFSGRTRCSTKTNCYSERSEESQPPSPETPGSAQNDSNRQGTP